MAINVYGVPASIGAKEWSQLLQDLGDAGAGMAVPAGLAATVSGSNLLVTAGRSLQAGTLAVSDAVATVAVAANSASTARLDYLVMQVDWTGSVQTAGSLLVVQGTSAAAPVAPALTRIPGVLWQTPLWRYTVAAKGSVASALTDVRPVALGERTCSGQVTLGDGDSKTVLFPPGFYTKPPRVVLTAVTSAANTTESNVYVTSQTATGFTVAYSRSTATNSLFNWIASGV